ncbi:hypothetical protein ACAF76_006515 [Brevibacillus sp. TJ4]|uniref:hypothetical protein n=1 Tax=Brevibacillus sp. TJ4 TaxID=3234853 RepID=UPI0037D92683
MTTNYYFTCTKCGTRGGSLSNQAWGWGNFEIVESFKFLAFHISHCGEESIRVISEEADDYIDLLHDEYNLFLEETKNIFPHSRDWEFLVRSQELPTDEIKQKWVDEQRIPYRDERMKVTGKIKELQIVKQGAGHYIYRGQVACTDGRLRAVLANARELPKLEQSYVIIGKEQAHPELGHVMEVHKMVPV